ncbi:hypothetical protein HPP92_010571 [Vanilla planifolia]|uniref:EF-hand domain-containing protein n=1 Tax=Vanilla planifolia TaxID=51239 RepID=A0A835RAP3_VANPL|nr:hypothetical protein HPP92_010571 [Vanilla planifolia]
MDALATLLLFAFLFLCFLLFFPHHKLLPWFHSLLLPTASHPKPKPKHKLPKDSFKTEGDDKEDEANLKTVFATFDSDGDGFISRGELAESLERIGLAITGAEVGSMMASADANGDGLIDLGTSEWTRFGLNRPPNFCEWRVLLSWGPPSRGVPRRAAARGRRHIHFRWDTLPMCRPTRFGFGLVRR